MTTVGWALIFISLIVAVISRILAEDAKTFIPRLSQRMLRSASQRINEVHAAGFFEEWLAHLQETPEITGKLWHASSIYFWGARRICNTVGYCSFAQTRFDRNKRLVDVLMIIFAVPILLLVVLPVFIVLFYQQGSFPLRSINRLGRNGMPFKLWKFRTIPIDAETVLARHLAENGNANHEWHTTGKLKDDPRVTSFGFFVRKLSLDELPQLWNVLMGDMSLIGPMPR